MVKGTDLENKSLEELIKTTEGGIFNNAAQVWNHTFYWNCLAPNAGGAPTGKIAEAINKAFGSFEEFKNNLMMQLQKLWFRLDLVSEKADGSLAIVNTSNAATPVSGEDKPLLTVDVWGARLLHRLS